MRILFSMCSDIHVPDISLLYRKLQCLAFFILQIFTSCFSMEIYVNSFPQFMFLFLFIAKYQKGVCFPNLNISLTGLSLYLNVNMSTGTCLCAVLIILSKFHFVMCDKHIQSKISQIFFILHQHLSPSNFFFWGGGLRLYKVFIAYMYNIEPPKSISFYPLFHFKIFIFTKIEPSSSSGQPNQFLKDNDYKLYVVHMSLEYVYTVYCGSLSFMCIKFFLSKIYLNLTTIESLLFLMDIYFHALPKQ